MKQKNTFRRTLSNNLFIFGLAFRISPKRVICHGVHYGLDQFEYLFFAGFFMKKVLSLIETGGSFPQVLLFLGLTVGTFFLIFLYNSWYDAFLVPVTDVDIYQGLYHRLYAKANNADLSCFEDSDFYNRYLMAMADSDKRLLSTIDNIWHLLMGSASVVISWIMMIRIDPFVILFALAPLIGNFVFAEGLNRLSYRIYEESIVFRRIADYVNRVIHLSDYAKELRMTHIYHVMEKKQQDAKAGITGTMDKYATKNILLGWGYLFFTFVIIFEGVIFYGAYRTLVSGTMALSDFAVLTTLMTSVSWTLINYTKALLESMKNSLYIQNLRNFLSFQPNLPENSDGIQPKEQVHRIEFRHVSFAYKPGRFILKDINFTLQEKESCALVGYNGAGKTTLIKLLLRLYDPTEGQILVNDIDIRKYNLKAYRKLFSAAFQDGKIFARSILDNLLMGQESSPGDALRQALSQAGILETIEHLPNGLSSTLTREFDQNGVVLSGGQYQKLLAARAFFREAPIRIFDEPSSALDPMAEYALMESIKQESREHILFLISHRLSSIQDMAKIIVLKNGRIAEVGTHDKLLAANGTYAALYRMQAEKYKMDIIQEEAL